MAQIEKALPIALRWLGLAALLIVLTCVMLIADGWIDAATQAICPQGWWHTSEFWAHCAYPPVSIAKYGLLYGGYAVLALLAIRLVAPSYKVLASAVILIAMIAPPAFHLLIVKFSWVEISKLVLVAAIALLFAIGVRRARNRSSKCETSGQIERV